MTPLSGASLAQDKPALAPKSAQRVSLTLGEALKKARSGAGITLAVDSGESDRDADELRKQGADTVERVAAAFEKTTRYFGNVMAVGPQTCTELLTDFSRANAFADMPPDEAFTLLMGSLDDRQRTALASKAGLGYSDLTTATQKQIFLVLLPENEASASLAGRADDTSLGVLRDKPNTVRFRVAQEVQLSCETTGDYPAREIQDQGQNLTSGPKVYRLNSWNTYRNLDKVNGVIIRRDAPNIPKPSDLNYNAPAFRAAVSLRNIKTVGELIARIAERTKIELYADTGYEKKPLAWAAAGRKDAASASELLRALAFCVAGTYRRVEPAFVLTDDLVGAGTRRQMIQDFEEECEAERHQAIKDAEKAVKASPEHNKLNSFGDPLAMTTAQEKLPPPDPDAHDGLAEIAVPREELTPAQQSAIEGYEAYVKANPGEFGGDWTPDFTKKIHVIKNTAVQMLINGVDGVVSTDFGADLNGMFESEKKKERSSADDLKPFENMKKWTDTAKKFSCRAVICRPRTAADVDASLLRIEKMGFNQMWLSVFENGKARIPGTPFPLDPACDPKTNLLTYAVSEGKKKGIAVCPVVDAYDWGKDAPKDLRLLTLRGEDSAQSALRRAKINALMPPDESENLSMQPWSDAPSPAVFVDLTDARVQAALKDLLQKITSHTGIDRIVCCAMAPEGFSEQDVWVPRKERADMGYTPALRLAFLRKRHKDPIDAIAPYFDGNYARANTAISNADNRDYRMMRVMQEWSKVRAEALTAAWQSLFGSAQGSAGNSRLTLLMGNGGGQEIIRWFNEWNDSKGPPPDGNLSQPAPDTGAKPDAAPMPSGVLLLSKQPPAPLPKELAKYDWRDVQLKMLEFYPQARTWAGIAIEE